MALPADYLVERLKLVRKVSRWRLAAFLAAAAFIIAIGLRLSGLGDGSTLRPHIARVAIEGIITGDKDTLKLLKDVGESKASAVILTIDSPGGTTTGAERLYEEIRRIAEKKPTIAVVGTLAASGGYIAALGADNIVARGNSLIGSIGVLFQTPNVAKLLDTVGVKIEEVKSSPLKASPNGFEPTSEAARAALASLVADSYTWFKGLVQTRRKLSDSELNVVADGRVFTGRQGLPLKLIDKIGGEREAVEWLETSRNVTKGLPVTDWKKKRPLDGLRLLGVAAGVADWAGFSGLAGAIGQADLYAQAHLLDGLTAIWHGSIEN